MLGICLGMQLLFESSTELGGAEGLGLLAGRGRRRSTRPGSRSRTSAGRRCAGSGESRDRRTGIGPSDAVLLRALASPRGPPTPPTCSAPRLRRALRLRGRARQRLRRPVPPREVERAGCGCSRTSPPSAPPSRPSVPSRLVILYPGDRHPRRPRRAPDAGRLRARDRLRRRPRRRGAGAGSTAAREWLHVVDLDGARAGEPVNLEHVARIAAAVPRCRSQLGGGLRDADRGRGGARRRGRARRARHRGARRPRARRRADRGPRPERIVVAVDARGGKVAARGLEPRATATTSGGLITALADRGVRGFVFTPVEVDGTLEGPGLDGLRRDRRRRRGRWRRADLLGRRRHARGPAHLAELAGLQLPALRRDRRPGALRGPLHGRGGPARRSRANLELDARTSRATRRRRQARCSRGGRCRWLEPDEALKRGSAVVPRSSKAARPRPNLIAN